MSILAATQQSNASQWLKQIREGYEQYKRTPHQLREADAQTQTSILETMTGNGASSETVARMAANFQQINNLINYEEDDRNKIVSWTFNYNLGGESVSPRRITITSEGSRHWRTATTSDIGKIVFLTNEEEFGELDDLGEEQDEELPDVTRTTAIIHTQSGKTETPHESNSMFECVLVVPEQVLEGVRHEAPPGKFFSGRTENAQAGWSPAPASRVWFQHPLLENSHGIYLSDRDYYHLESFLRLGSFGTDPQRGWEHCGSKAYWCPVLKRFISEGERLRQEHWFHNGDGSAQQRYFYNQFEMLDRHGGLASLEHVKEEDVAVMEVRSPQEVMNLKFQLAEEQGNVINVE